MPPLRGHHQLLDIAQGVAQPSTDLCNKAVEDITARSAVEFHRFLKVGRRLQNSVALVVIALKCSQNCDDVDVETVPYAI